MSKSNQVTYPQTSASQTHPSQYECPNDARNGDGSYNRTHPLPCYVEHCDCKLPLEKTA